MADPFRPNAKSQLLREAQVGLSIVAILLVLLVYVAFYRLTGRGRHIPNHVRNAPVAQVVWPQNDKPIATREIEMTAQEFRDTRMPKPNLVARSGSKIAALSPTDSADTKIQASQSSLRSTYQIQPSTASMAEVKTSRPNTQLENPNFSPDSKSAGKMRTGKKLVPSIVADSLEPNSASDFPIPKTPRLVKAPETIGFSGTKAIHPKEVESVASVKSPQALKAAKSLVPIEPTNKPLANPPANPPNDPFMIKDLDDSRIDSKVKLASLEDDGNQFRAELPVAIEVASLKSAPTVDSKSREFQPIQPRKDSTGSKSKGLSDFVALKNNSNALRPQPENHGSFINPALAPSQPVADRGNDPVLAKRLPRLQSASKSPADKTLFKEKQEENREEKQEKKQTKEQFRQSTLSKREYVTKAGDNFWSIAQSIYNDGRYFRALYKYNEPKVPDFDSLETGTIIGTPAKEDLVKLWPDLCPAAEAIQVAQNQNATELQNGPIYITRRGDTVFDIARQRLGQASRYSEILNLNQIGLGQEVSHLTPLEKGVRIVMPK